MVRAVSRDEAVGKALRVATKAYPGSSGWFGHHAVVCPATNVVDPDNELSVTEL